MKKETVYNAILAMFTCGAVGALRPVMVTALVLWLLRAFVLGDWPDIKALLKEKLVKQTLFFLGAMVGLIALDGLVLKDKATMVMAMHYGERMLPCILTFLMTYKRKEILPAVFWGSFLGILFLSGTAVYERIVSDIDRVNGYLGHPNKMGGWAIMIIPFFLACMLELRKKKGIKEIGILGSILALTTIALGLSRGAILGALACAAVAFFLYASKKVKLVICSAVIALGMGFLSMYQANSTGYEQIKDNRWMKRSYDMERIYLLQSGTQMFLDHTLFGVGAGNYNKLYNEKYINPNAKEPYLNSPHNIILHYLAYFGLVGSAGIFALVIGQFNLLLSWFKGFFNKDYLVASFIVILAGVFTQGMVDSIPVNKFFMQLYGFLWAILCWWIMNKEETIKESA